MYEVESLVVSRFGYSLVMTFSRFYRLPYKDILGGIVAISRRNFLRTNGYSNQFFGWGGEDDDFSSRYVTRCHNSDVTLHRAVKRCDATPGGEAL